MADEIKVVPVVDGEERTDAAATFTVSESANIDFHTYVDGELVEASYLLPDKVYNILKWAAMLGIPAFSTLVQAIGSIWGLDIAEPIALTITAFGTFLGAIIGVSAAKNYLN